MISAMKRAALALVLAACSTSSKDFPPLPGGSGPGGTSGGGGGTVGDGGMGSGGDAGTLINRRVCIVSDLRTPTICDATKNASGVKVTLGTQTPVSLPARTGEFTIVQPLDTDLVWHVTGAGFVTSVVPFSSEVTIPIVPEALYDELQSSNTLMIVEGQGSVLARAVIGSSPVAGVLATSTLVVNTPPVPLYGPDPSIRDATATWRDTGPTLGNGAIWFPGVDVTTTPAQITFTRQGGAPVSTRVNVEDQAITFIIKDVQ